MQIFTILKKNLSKKQNIYFYIFILFAILSMILEMIGIGLIIPIIKIFTQDNIFFDKLSFLNSLDLDQYPKNELIIISLSSIIFIYFLKTIFLTYVSYAQGKYLTEIKKTTSERLYLNYLNKPYEFFLNTNSFQLIRNINDVIYFGVLVNSVLMFITELTILIGISLLLIYYEPLGSIIIILIIAIIGILFSSKIKKKSEFWGGKRKNADGQKLKSMQESFRLIQEIKVLNINRYFISKFFNSNKISAINEFKHQFVLSLPRYWFELLAVFGFAILMFILNYSGYKVDDLITVIGLFAAATFKLLPSIIRLINNIQQIHFSLPVLKNISKELRNKFFLFNLEDTIKNNKLSFKNEIYLNNISFKYQNSKKKVLDKINLKILKGTTIGIMGTSGVGKTTLINLLLGLLKPSSGSILVDNKNISKDLKSWQNNIGYVPQNINLIDESLENNIALGVEKKNINNDRIIECIKETQLANLIKNNKNGVRTHVGEFGSRLSGGQKQRIGIARSIYKNPEILILDEFTNGLDNLTEKKIVNEIQNYSKNKTVIIISHKLSTLSACDKIYQLTNNGLNLT
jgi:ATP-binding cassette, subfamily B, bacterial PglK